MLRSDSSSAISVFFNPSECRIEALSIKIEQVLNQTEVPNQVVAEDGRDQQQRFHMVNSVVVVAETETVLKVF